MDITFVDDEKFITLRPGEERASHKRGRKALKEFGDMGGQVVGERPTSRMIRWWLRWAARWVQGVGKPTNEST